MINTPRHPAQLTIVHRNLRFPGDIGFGELLGDRNQGGIIRVFKGGRTLAAGRDYEAISISEYEEIMG